MKNRRNVSLFDFEHNYRQEKNDSAVDENLGRQGENRVPKFTY